MLPILLSLLLGVSYGQSQSFSKSCPEINGSHAQPGCVAVAMLHVMAHNSFPSQGTGTVAYTTPSYRLPISEDLSTFSFDWQKMRSLATSEDTLAASKALYVCGVAAKTDFCPENSTASFPNMINAFIKNFGYDPDITVRSRECYDRTAWISMLKEEIDGNRMVVMQANDHNYGSHAFVVDGYEILPNDTLFHINWGWEGVNNGYYDIDCLSPGIFSFSEENKIVINCKPDDGIKTIENYLECHLSLPGERYSTNERVTGSVEVVNRSSRSFKGSYIEPLSHSHILLVDDVTTTGATLMAVANALQKVRAGGLADDLSAFPWRVSHKLALQPCAGASCQPHPASAKREAR